MADYDGKDKKHANVSTNIYKFQFQDDDAWDEQSDDDHIEQKESKVKQVSTKNKNQGLNSLFTGSQSTTTSNTVQAKKNDGKKNFKKDNRKKDDAKPNFYTSKNFADEEKSNFVKIEVKEKTNVPTTNKETTNEVPEIVKPNIIASSEGKLMDLDTKADVS